MRSARRMSGEASLIAACSSSLPALSLLGSATNGPRHAAAYPSTSRQEAAGSLPPGKRLRAVLAALPRLGLHRQRRGDRSPGRRCGGVWQFARCVSDET
jgi:hypothetical protein